MIYLRQSLVLSTLFLSAFSSPTPLDQQQQQRQRSRLPADKEAFQRLLADVDESSLHSLLHHWSSKFKDGVFSRDRTALEAVHSENAPIATSLLNLAKRQDGNNTVSSSPPTTITESPPTSSVDPESPPPSSSDESELPPSSTTVDSQPPPASTTDNPESPAATSSSSNDNDDDTQSPSPAAPASSRITATRAPTTQAVPVTTPSSATPIATSSGRVVFSVSANSGSSGRLTTIDETSEIITFSPSSSTVLSTFTLADGALSTMTSVTVVDAPVTGGGVGAPAASATGGTGDPGLQEGVASATRRVWKEVVAVVGGAVVMGLAM